MWDNRVSKTNPKQPDYKCRNRACDGVIWPPRNGTAQRTPAPQQNTAPQPFSIGGPLPWEDAASAPTPAVAPTSVSPDQFVQMAQLYSRCVDTAVAISRSSGIAALPGDAASAVAAMSATLFIGAKDRGIAR